MNKWEWENWDQEGTGERITKNSRESIQANASLFTNEIRVTSWVFIQGLAPIPMVVHLAHVPAF